MMQQTVQQHDLLNELQAIRKRMGLKRSMFSVLVQDDGYRVLRVGPADREVDDLIIQEKEWQMLQDGHDRSIG